MQDWAPLHFHSGRLVYLDHASLGIWMGRRGISVHTSRSVHLLCRSLNVYSTAPVVGVVLHEENSRCQWWVSRQANNLNTFDERLTSTCSPNLHLPKICDVTAYERSCDSVLQSLGLLTHLTQWDMRLYATPSFGVTTADSTSLSGALGHSLSTTLMFQAIHKKTF